MKRNLWYPILSIILIICLCIVLAKYTHIFPSTYQFLQSLGVKHLMIAVAVFSFLAGFSSFIALGFYAFLIIVLAQDPALLPLAFVVALMMTLSNILIIRAGKIARVFVPRRMERFFNKVLAWVEHRPEWMVMTCISLCMVFLPLPREVIFIQLSLMNYSLRKAAIALFIGNFLFTLLFAFIIHGGVSALQSHLITFS